MNILGMQVDVLQNRAQVCGNRRFVLKAGTTLAECHRDLPNSGQSARVRWVRSHTQSIAHTGGASAAMHGAIAPRQHAHAAGDEFLYFSVAVTAACRRRDGCVADPSGGAEM